ncbi:hypothetical protein PTTG_29869, partial [Puccinia triticina 1-1 BBBD Race 1]
PLDPPPAHQFKLMNNLFHFCQTWAKNQGFAVAKSNSVTGKNVYIGCDCLGGYCGSGTKKSEQQTLTKKIDCPFELYGLIPTTMVKGFCYRKRCAAQSAALFGLATLR